MQTVPEKKSFEIAGRENGGRLFEKFREEILEDRIPDIITPQEYLCRQDLKFLKIGSLVVIVLNLFWCIKDALGGGTLNLTSGVAPVVIALQIAVSVAVFIESVRLDRRRKMDARRAENLLLVFHLSIFVAVTVLKVTKNITIVENGMVSRFNSIPISTYLLIAVAITPLPSRRSTLILFFCNIVSLVLPVFLPGSEAYPFTQSLIFHFSIAVIYASFLGISTELGSNVASVQQAGNSLACTSYVDPLTGILNRRALDEYLKKLPGNGSVGEVGVFFYDVDNFKSFNDTYTHIEGDRVLETVSAAVTDEFRDDSAYVFRYGGEEFVVITENADAESVRRDGERIRTAVRRAAIPRGDLAGAGIVTVTVGCSLESADCDGRDLIGAADTALYEGKAGSKDCVVFKG